MSQAKFVSSHYRLILANLLAVMALFCCQRAALSKEPKILHFPDNQSIGSVYILKVDRTRDILMPSSDQHWRAQGTVKFPAEALLSLNGSYALAEHSDLLLNLPADAFHQLSLGKLPMTDKDLENVSHLTGLVALDLDESDITDDGIKYLAGLKNLQYLNLGHTLITGKTIGQLQGISHLRSLDLNHTDLGKTDLTGLVKLKDLRYLHLSNCNLNDGSMTSIAKLPLLTNLSVPGNKELSGVGIKKMATNMNLRRLDVSETKVTASDLEALQGHDLTSLEIRKDQGVTRSLAKLVTMFPKAVVKIKSDPRMPLELFKPLH